MPDMMDFYRQSVAPHLEWLGGWNYLFLFVFVMVEGPVATILGAAAASAGLLNPALVFLSCATGNLLGDLMWYALGRLMPRPWLLRSARVFGLHEGVLEDLETRVRDNAARLVVAAKLTWLMAQQTFIVAGIARVPLREWLLLNVIAECLWTGLLVASGYWLVTWISSMQQWMQWASIAAYALVLTLGVSLVRRLHAERITKSKFSPAVTHL